MSFVPRRSPRLAAKAAKAAEAIKTDSRPYMVISPVVDVPALRALFLKEREKGNRLSFDETKTFYTAVSEYLTAVQNCEYADKTKQTKLTLDMFGFFFDNIAKLAQCLVLCIALRKICDVEYSISQESPAIRKELADASRDLLHIIAE